MRTRVRARQQAAADEQCRDHPRDRRLAVGAGDVHGGKVELRRTEQRRQRFDARPGGRGRAPVGAGGKTHRLEVDVCIEPGASLDGVHSLRLTRVGGHHLDVYRDLVAEIGVEAADAARLEHIAARAFKSGKALARVGDAQVRDIGAQ